MSRRLTTSTSLDNLKKEAKRWLKALRSGDAGARARLADAWPDAPHDPVLRDVQHALAREHGLAGWSALKAELEQMHAASSSSSAALTLERYEEIAKNLLV